MPSMPNWHACTFPRSKSVRSKNIIQPIYIDTLGPVLQLAKHGFKYVLSYIDDYSHRILCYPIRTKDEVYPKPLNSISLKEKQMKRFAQSVRMIN